MTRAEKLAAIAELTALKKETVDRFNVVDWLEKVLVRIRRFLPDSNLESEIKQLVEPWTLTDEEVKAQRYMTFKQAVDSVKGKLGSIVLQLNAEVDLHLNEDQ